MPPSKLTFCCRDHMLYYITLCVLPTDSPFVSWHCQMTDRVEVCSTCQRYLDINQYSFVMDDVCKDAFTNYELMQNAVENRLHVFGISPLTRYLFEMYATTNSSYYTINYASLTNYLINVVGKWVNLMLQNGLNFSMSYEDTWNYLYQQIKSMSNANLVTNIGTLILVNLGNILSQFFEQFISNAMFYTVQKRIVVGNNIQDYEYYYPGLAVTLLKVNQSQNSVDTQCTLTTKK